MKHPRDFKERSLIIQVLICQGCYKIMWEKCWFCDFGKESILNIGNSERRKTECLKYWETLPLPPSNGG